MEKNSITFWLVLYSCNKDVLIFRWDEKLAKHNNQQQLLSNNDDVTTTNDVTVKQVDTSSQKQGRSTFYVNNKNGGKNESREYRPMKSGASDIIKMHDQVFDVEGLVI